MGATHLRLLRDRNPTRQESAVHATANPSLCMPSDEFARKQKTPLGEWKSGARSTTYSAWPTKTRKYCTGRITGVAAMHRPHATTPWMIVLCGYCSGVIGDFGRSLDHATFDIHRHTAGRTTFV